MPGVIYRSIQLVALLAGVTGLLSRFYFAHPLYAVLIGLIWRRYIYRYFPKSVVSGCMISFLGVIRDGWDHKKLECTSMTPLSNETTYTTASGKCAQKGSASTCGWLQWTRKPDLTYCLTKKYPSHTRKVHSARHLFQWRSCSKQFNTTGRT